MLGEFEQDEYYIQPYWLLTSNETPFPAFEMMGPFVGYRVTQPRIPNDDGTSQACLWKASEELTGCEFPER